VSDIAYPARDYGLLGPEAERASEAGLAAAQWYHSEVPRRTMKDLMQRRDGPAIRDTLLWIALHIILAAGGIALWGTWWAVPFWLAYGVLYGSACDSRWHECGHNTAFRTRWMNDVVYHIASFQVMRNPINWRWSHVGHHTDTIIVGRDPEIVWMHPIKLVIIGLAYVGLRDAWVSLKVLGRNALGQLSEEERSYIPETAWPRAIFWARVHMAIYAAVVMATMLLLVTGAGWQAAIPVLLIGGPRVYGCWHMVMTGLLQHGGLAEDVLDHRLNTRTVYMNPISRWLYWNMNYHIEHHMFPMVPYHALPKLHELVKDDMPPPNRSIAEAYLELYRAVMRQRREPGYALQKPLPPSARPYEPGLHLDVPERAPA
jgi:fatty acid desaturase